MILPESFLLGLSFLFVTDFQRNRKCSSFVLEHSRRGIRLDILKRALTAFPLGTAAITSGEGDVGSGIFR